MVMLCGKLWYKKERILLLDDKRLKEIDILRALAFIFVVVQHGMGGLSFSSKIGIIDKVSLRLFYMVGKPAVQIFLFISGLSLSYVYSRKLNLKNYYIKRIKYVIIPYLIWSVINMYKLGNKDRLAQFFLQSVAGNGAFHLWYMGGIIRLYIFFPIILYISKKVHSMNKSARIAIFSSILILYYQIFKYKNLISDKAALFIFRTPSDLQHKMVDISMLFWILYFILGIYAALNYEYIKEKLLKYKVIIYISYFILLAYAYFNDLDVIPFNRVLTIAYTTSSILFFYIISCQVVNKQKVYKCMRFISDYSFASYMAHVIVLSKVANQINAWNVNIPNFLYASIITIATVFITSVIIYLISCVPFTGVITGIKNNNSKILKFKKFFSAFVKPNEYNISNKN